MRGANGHLVISLSDEYPGYPECGQDLRMDIDPADANLLISAPDLYEALETMMADYMRMNCALTAIGKGAHMDAAHPDCPFQIAVAALACARGEA